MRRALFAVAALALGCDEADQLRAIRPRLEVTPAELDFGSVPLGGTRRLAVEVGNPGSAPLVVGDISVSPPFALGSAPPQLAPGASARLDVRFAPTDTEPASGRLVVTAEALSQAVDLTGSGVEGAVFATPERLDLLQTPVGVARSAEVVLENIGLEGVAGRLVLEAGSGAGFFTDARGAPLDRALTVPARGTVTLDVAYRPLEPGPHPAVLRFELCGDRCGVEARIEASAVEPTVRLEPAVLDFGEVGIGERRSQVLAVRNEGDEVATVRRVRLRAAGEGLALVLPELPAALDPGEAAVVEVRFAPERALELSGAVVVELEPTSARDLPQVEAAVVGRASGPRFVVRPERLVVGVVTRPDPVERTLVALNAGTADLQVTEIALTGDPELGLVSVPPLPVRLAGGEALPLRLGFAPSALGAYSATIAFGSDDPVAPEARVPVVAGFAERACQLEITPETVNFGAVTPGFARERTVAVVNRGQEPCVLRSGAQRAPTDPAFSLVGASPLPSTLDPGGRTELRFGFAPAEERASKSTFVLTTDEPLFPERSLSLVGTGAAYEDLSVRPRVLDFGATRLACPPALGGFQLVNSGSRPARVLSARLEDTDPAFTLPAPGSPLRLPSGGTAAFQVRYDPPAEAVDEGRVVLELQDRPFPIVVPLRGSGALEPVEEERFVQQDRKNVDVLFVIDNSCSMADEQQAIAQNFQSFIQQARFRQVDFRLGVTTTTVLGSGGALVGPPLSPQTSNLESAFADQANVGTGGSAQELGLEALRGAIRRAESGFTDNARLLRRGTEKVFVIVSDEDDRSRLPVLSYVVDVEQRYADPVVAVVSGGRNGCARGGTAQAAPRYVDFVDALNGLDVSICGRWGDTLTTLGQAAFGLVTRFELSRTPELPVEVLLNGSPLPPSRFSVDGEAVVVEPAPDPGDEVVVRYTPACES